MCETMCHLSFYKTYVSRMSSTLIHVVVDVMTVHRVVTPHFLYLFTRG